VTLITAADKLHGGGVAVVDHINHDGGVLGGAKAVTLPEQVGHVEAAVAIGATVSPQIFLVDAVTAKPFGDIIRHAQVHESVGVESMSQFTVSTEVLILVIWRVLVVEHICMQILTPFVYRTIGPDKQPRIGTKIVVELSLIGPTVEAVVRQPGRFAGEHFGNSRRAAVSQPATLTGEEEVTFFQTGDRSTEVSGVIVLVVDILDAAGEVVTDNFQVAVVFVRAHV